MRANEWEMRGPPSPRVIPEQTPSEREAEEEWLEKRTYELRPTTIQRAQSGLVLVFKRIGRLVGIGRKDAPQ